MPKLAFGGNSRNPATNIYRPVAASQALTGANPTGPEPLPALGLSTHVRNLSAPGPALKVRAYADSSATVYRDKEPPSVPEAQAQTILKQQRAAQLKAAHEAYLARTGGIRRQVGLTSKAARKVKRAVRLIAHTRKYNAFVTLTFGQWVPDHATAKRLLSLWFRRLNRKYGRVPYVWVAELQGRGAIHFHVYAGRWIDKNWLNESWNAVVNSEAIARGQMPQPLTPNVRGGKSTKGRYMAKTVGLYMAKVDATYARMKGKDVSALEIRGNTHGMDAEARTLINGTVLRLTYADPDTLETAFLEALDAAQGREIAFGQSFMLGWTARAEMMLEALTAYATGPPNIEKSFFKDA